MNKLFGIPMTNIMVALLIVLALVLAITAYVAIRNPVIFRLGIRNVPRRKAQTGLIVIGLMLSTLIMSAAFATGDTINYSIGDVVYKSLGRVDEVIQPKQDPNSAGQGTDKIPAPVLTDLETRFKGDPDIAGFVPSLGKAVPALNPRTSQSEPIVSLAGVDAKRVDAIGGVVRYERQQTGHRHARPRRGIPEQDGRGQVAGAGRRHAPVLLQQPAAHLQGRGDRAGQHLQRQHERQRLARPAHPARPRAGDVQPAERLRRDLRRQHRHGPQRREPHRRGRGQTRSRARARRTSKRTRSSRTPSNWPSWPAISSRPSSSSSASSPSRRASCSSSSSSPCSRRSGRARWAWPAPSAPSGGTSCRCSSPRGRPMT